MLSMLAANPGETVPREALAGLSRASNERTIDVQINRLRRKIERIPPIPSHLQTVRGIGYRLSSIRARRMQRPGPHDNRPGRGWPSRQVSRWIAGGCPRACLPGR